MEVVSDHQVKLGSSSSSKMHLQASLDANSFDGSYLQMSSCSDEHVFKVRKPYTITKQRERWTKEEHDKFLEALKLYGRDWRRIEEHVGTKTAVQIRSHAQKFFSKVTRDSSGNPANGTAIEIPPPRPKRKPMHPYPRKLGNLSTKGTLDMPEENGSPTSILSGIGSSFSNSTSGSTSPSSTDGSTPAGMSPNDKEKYQTHSSDEEATRLLLQLPTSMDHDNGTGVVTRCNEDQLVEAETAPPTLKLFGRPVLVADSKRRSSLSVDDANCDQSAPVANVDHQDVGGDHDGEVTGQVINSPGNDVWNPLMGSLPRMFYFMPRGGNLPAEVPVVPVPWWAVYGGVPLPFAHQQEPFFTQSAEQSCIETEHLSRQPKEGSWTGSVSEVGPVDRNDDIVEFRSTAYSLKSCDGPCRGFVPYKRRLAERESQQSEVANEDGDSQRIRLSL